MARSRYRSVRYDLAAAIEVARLADSAGGSIGPDILAPALGYRGTNSGAYLSRVASARLFGLVEGRGSRLQVTGRGHLILAGDGREASRARRDAFLAVPLFAAVHDALASTGGGLPEDLPGWLVADFGETADKARGASERMVASGTQAGILQTTPEGRIQFVPAPTHFTPVDNSSSLRRFGPVWLRRGDRSPGMEEVAVADGGLWLDEEPDGHSARTSPWRRRAVAGTVAVVLTAVAVPVALMAGGPQRSDASRTTAREPRLEHGPAEHMVLAALSATTDTGSFDFSYTIHSTPATGTTTTPTTVCQQQLVPVPSGATSIGSGTNGGGVITPSVATATAVGSSAAGSGSGDTGTGAGAPPPGMTWRSEKVCTGPAVPPDPVVQGSGIINTNPLAMVASADIGGGLDVTVRVNDASVYEEGSNDTGLAPQPSDAPGSGNSLPQFAGITEGTLGSREGAVAMMGMASPTGYLDLIAPAITAAGETGTGTVGGVAVTNYQITNDLSQLAGAAGTSPAESQTISTALDLLNTEGYTSNDVVVSVDGSGFIRQVRSTDVFGDGGTVTLEATFSDFGCAGTILMPGQTGSGVPPVGCTPPTGTSATATTSTTSTLAPEAAPSSTAPSTSTTNPSGPAQTGSPATSTTTTTTLNATKGASTPSTTKPLTSTSISSP